jgi:hypothetical protein
MAIPLRITGPAVVIFNGVTYYFQDGLKGELKRNTENITVDNFGAIAAVAKNFIVEFTGRPAGVLDATYLTSMFPDARNNHGSSVFGATDLPLVIWAQHPFDGTDLNKVTWKRGAISKSPSIMCTATRGQIVTGEMTFTALMASDFNLTSASAWYSAVNATYTGATLDITKIRYARYTAALGARATPYDSMLAIDGFTLDATFTTKDIEVDNFGVIDRVYDASSYIATVKFKPANLTKAQVDSLIKIQDTTALLPGDVIGGNNEDLVISSNKMIVTLKNCDAASSEDFYKTGTLQRGEVMFINAISTTGTGTGMTVNRAFTFTNVP